MRYRQNRTYHRLFKKAVHYGLSDVHGMQNTGRQVCERRREAIRQCPCNQRNLCCTLES